MALVNSTVILARVSSKAQEEEGYSLDSQIKLLYSYCKNKKLEVVRVFKITETASKQQGRTVFHEMIQYLKREKIYHLAVEKTDRLTRNMRDAVTIDDWLEANENRRLHAVKEDLLLHKNAKSDVKFVWSIYLAFAKKYTDNLREEAMKGWAEKLAQGWMPAPPPPGYMTAIDRGKKIHIPNPATLQKIQKLFELYLSSDHTVHSVTDEAESLGLMSSKGRPYSKSHVHKILNNPYYIGTIRFNGKEYPGAQEPIIDQDTFGRVQNKLHGRHKKLRIKHDPIFRGILSCPTCSSAIVWSKQKGRFYGACKRDNPMCKKKPLLREDRIEARVIAQLRNIKKPRSALKKLEETLHTGYEPQNIESHRMQVVGVLTGQIKKLQQMDNMLYEDKLAGAITIEKYLVKHTEFTAKMDELTDRLNLLQAQQNATTELSEPVDRNPLVNFYLKSTPSKKRTIINTLTKSNIALTTLL